MARCARFVSALDDQIEGLAFLDHAHRRARAALDRNDAGVQILDFGVERCVARTQAFVLGRLLRDFALEPVRVRDAAVGDPQPRSEEHTSELQSLMRNSYAVFCLKKKKKNN